MKTLLRAIIKWVIELIDPEYKVELDAYYKRRQEQADKAIAIQKEIAALEQRRFDLGVIKDKLDLQIKELLAGIDELNRKKEVVKQDEKKALDELAGLSDSDVIRSEL